MLAKQAEILDCLYAGVLETAALERALDLLMEGFRCPSVTLLSVDRHTPANNLILVAGTFREATDQYVSEFAAIDPAPAAYARLAVGKAASSRDILSAADHNGPFVNEFYHPVGFAETLGGNLASGKARSALIGLQRGFDREPFEPDEIAAVEG